MNFRALKLIDKTAFFLIVIAFLFTIIFPFLLDNAILFYTQI